MPEKILDFANGVVNGVTHRYEWAKDYAMTVVLKKPKKRLNCLFNLLIIWRNLKIFTG